MMMLVLGLVPVWAPFRWPHQVKRLKRKQRWFAELGVAAPKLTEPENKEVSLNPPLETPAWEKPVEPAKEKKVAKEKKKGYLLIIIYFILY